MNSKLNNIIKELFSISRFTSYFYQAVNFSANEDIPTIALSISKSRMTFQYNGSFLESITKNEIIALMVHEMLHVLFSHDHRGTSDMDNSIKNLAQDMIVNSYIEECSDSFFSVPKSMYEETEYLTLPDGLPYVPGKFTLDSGIKDPSWEELYSWLYDKSKLPRRSADFQEDEEGGTPSGNKDNSQNEDYSFAESDSSLSMNDESGETLPTGIHLLDSPIDELDSFKKRIINFASRDESCKNERIFTDLSRFIESAEEIDTTAWQKRIRSIVDYSSQSREWINSYSRFNKRYFAQGIYSPGRVFKENQKITIAVDVSASMVMTPGDIESAFGVIENLLRKYIINLLCIDENLFVPIKDDYNFKNRDLNREFKYQKGDWKYIKTGSSGTTFFAPLFNDYMKGKSEMLIVITDGYIYDEQKLNRYNPTLWIISEHRPEKFIPPFGNCVKIKN